MTKETLTDEAIRYDVLGNEVKKAKTNDYKSLVWVAPIMVAALAVGYFVHVLLGLLIGLGAIVPIYFYFKQNKADAGVIFQVEHDCEFVVEIDTLSHIDQETVYEPHVHHNTLSAGSDMHYTKTVTVLKFYNAQWRVPETEKLYAWSKEMYISPQGLQNTALRGDKFYVVRRKGEAEVAFAYNMKFFTYRGDSLK